MVLYQYWSPTVSILNKCSTVLCACMPTVGDLDSELGRRWWLFTSFLKTLFGMKVPFFLSFGSIIIWNQFMLSQKCELLACQDDCSTSFFHVRFLKNNRCGLVEPVPILLWKFFRESGNLKGTVECPVEIYESRFAGRSKYWNGRRLKGYVVKEVEK